MFTILVVLKSKWKLLQLCPAIGFFSFFLFWQFLTCCMKTFHNYYFCSLKKKFSLVALILFVPLTPPPPPPFFFSFPGVMDGSWGWVGWEGVEGVTVWWGQVCIPEDHQCFHCPALCSRYHTSWTCKWTPSISEDSHFDADVPEKATRFIIQWGDHNKTFAELCSVWSDQKLKLSI